MIALRKPKSAFSLDRSPSSRTPSDRLLQRSVFLALLLEICVFLEPAPVDGLIVILFGAALIFGKLSFQEISPVPVVALAAFGGAGLVSMSQADSPERALLYLLVTFYLIISWAFFVGLMGRYGWGFTESMVQAFCLAGLISSALGVAGYFRLVPFYDLLLLNGRARGLFKDCNVYGPYFVFMILVAFSRLTGTSVDWRRRAYMLLLFSSAAFALLLSFSRAAWINLGISLSLFLAGQLFFLSSPQERRKRLMISGAMLGIFGFLMGITLTVPAVSDMLSQRVSSTGFKDYDRVRFATQQLALATAVERPLGIGPGQVEDAFVVSTHSMYLRVLTENGLIALVGFLVFILANLVRAFRVMRQAENPAVRELNLIVACCIVGHLVNSGVVDTVHWRHIWFIYALPWAPYRIAGTYEWASRLAGSIRPARRFSYGL